VSAKWRCARFRLATSAEQVGGDPEQPRRSVRPRLVVAATALVRDKKGLGHHVLGLVRTDPPGAVPEQALRVPIEQHAEVGAGSGDQLGIRDHLVPVVRCL
jgi:hypothetical protein